MDSRRAPSSCRSGSQLAVSRGKKVKHWPCCTDSARILHGCCTVLHGSALFIFRVGSHRSRKLRKPKPTYPVLSLAQRMRRDFALAGTLPHAATTKTQRLGPPSQRPRRVRAQPFACCRHTVRFFGFSFSPAHEEIVSPGSLRDRGKARTTPGPILCRSSSQLA